MRSVPSKLNGVRADECLKRLKPKAEREEEDERKNGARHSGQTAARINANAARTTSLQILDIKYGITGVNTRRGSAIGRRAESRDDINHSISDKGLEHEPGTGGKGDEPTMIAEYDRRPVCSPEFARKRAIINAFTARTPVSSQRMPRSSDPNQTMTEQHRRNGANQPDGFPEDIEKDQTNTMTCTREAWPRISSIIVQRGHYASRAGASMICSAVCIAFEAAMRILSATAQRCVTSTACVRTRPI